VKTDVDIISGLVSHEGKFRCGWCETEQMVKAADEWSDDGDRTLNRRALDYYDQHSFDGDGKAYYLEEFDGKYWRTIAFGTAGKSYDAQCSEMVRQLLSGAYIYSCSNGFRDWSAIPKAKSREELALKLSALGLSGK